MGTRSPNRGAQKESRQLADLGTGESRYERAFPGFAPIRKAAKNAAITLPLRKAFMRMPRFQVHLSTCVVLMFVAGLFLWANASPAFIYGIPENFYLSRGWPELAILESNHDHVSDFAFFWKQLAFNALTAAIALWVVAYLLERKAQKKSFKLHAVTWMNLAIAFGGLVYANLKPGFNELNFQGLLNVQYERGWPYVAYLTMYNVVTGGFWFGGVAANLIYAAGILLATAILCEWLIRRRSNSQ